ncbi:MAG: hypothetical protein H6Q25_1377 [Bacteroidetes bacterium]|nr:hypothetical protein [Bacteroidota bacterium]
MKKTNLFLWVSLLLCSFTTMAQDIIVFTDGSVEKAKIMEINLNEVKYKKWDNLEGPLYSLPKNSILSITYQNGTTEKFSNPATNQQDTQNQQDQPLSDTPSTGELKYDKDSPSKLSIYGDYLSEKDAIDFLYYKNENIYNDTWIEANKQCIIGKRILYPGLVLMVVSGTLGLAFLDDLEEDASYFAIPGAAGFTLWVTGMIINSVGNKRMTWVLNTYNNEIRYKPTLKLGFTGNGVGLQLKF